MGKITDEQREIIDGFSCERLTSRQENEELIKNFSCQRGQGLVRYLREFAWREDLEGTTANYLVKSPEGDIALFFSLKCGALFNPLDEDLLAERAKRAQQLLEDIRGIDKDGEAKEFALQILEQFRAGQDISFEQIKSRIKITAQQWQQVLNNLNFDKEHEGNKQIIRVGDTYPAIDLVNFCVNDAARERWKQNGIMHPIGEVMFWTFIAPKICEVQKYVGCQYVFLFAAGVSPDGTLVNYYNVELKFEQPADIGANKPRYDFCCQFMCQKVNDLKINMESYFINFNPDKEDIIA